MLTEFSKDKSRKPLITYIVALSAIVFTLINVFTNSYDNFLEKDRLLRVLLLPFHHGFDFTSSIIHLLFSILFLWYFGKLAEKLLGSFHFMMLFLTAYIAYVALQYFFKMNGYGLTPIVFCIVVYAFAAMTEAKGIKPRIVHEKLYVRVNSIGVGFMLTSLLLFSFLPVFYDIKETTILKGVFEGNFLHLCEVLLGLITLVFLRRKLKMSWLSFNKRKKFSSKSRNKKATYAAFIFSLGIIFTLLI